MQVGVAYGPFYVYNYNTTLRLSVNEMNFYSLYFNNQTTSYLEGGSLNVSGSNAGSGHGHYDDALQITQSAKLYHTGGTINQGSVTVKKDLDGLQTTPAYITIDNGFYQQTGGVTLNRGYTRVKNGGVAELGVSNGFKTDIMELIDGGKVLIKADNALVKYNEENSLGLDFSGVGNELRLYANQYITTLSSAVDNSSIDIYVNGFNLEVDYLAMSSTSKINLIVEEGYDWVNGSVHFTQVTADLASEFIDKVIVDGEEIEKSYISIVSDGSNGSFVNLTAVPEPAEWAAIIGFIALGFVVYHRRK